MTGRRGRAQASVADDSQDSGQNNDQQQAAPNNPQPVNNGPNAAADIPIAPALPVFPTADQIARSMLQQLMGAGPQHPMFQMIAQAAAPHIPAAARPQNLILGPANPPPNRQQQPGLNPHLRPLLKTSDITIPTYSGAADKKTPFDFLEEF
ncbi:hypothetical protein Fcan01_20008 [Folsomia candida]|uniref:Uncharacterized protein n=1 Tax=Folsomia candida TaxID=158441 RepID=A0A226DLQ1_FOLCA|nr:hypothetical protein Fcan01_20008 [Folsomia candida]